MKTKMLAALALGSLLVSCAKNESVDENVSKQSVSFKTGMHNTKTRGIDNTRLTLEASTDGIGLFAYRGTSGFLGSTSTDATVLVNNKLIYEAPNWVIKDGSNNTIKLYWPDLGSNEKYSFYAYYPRNTSGVSNLSPNVVGATEIPKFNFTVADNVADQVDLLVARWINPTSQPANTVALTFNHATTKVAFAARTNVDNWQVTIHNVQIQNVYNSALYTFPTKEGALDQIERNATWTNFSGNANYTLPLGTTTVFDKNTNAGNFNLVTSEAAGQSPFLLSQDLSDTHPNIPKLVVTYSILNTGTGQFVFNNATKEFNIGNTNTNSSDDLTTTWNRGSIVTYKYTFTNATSGPGSEIVFTVDVNGWTPMEYSLD